jgi:hypothetical protein
MKTEVLLYFSANPSHKSQFCFLFLFSYLICTQWQWTISYSTLSKQ